MHTHTHMGEQKECNREGGEMGKKTRFEITCCGIVCGRELLMQSEDMGGLNVTDVRGK